MAYAFDLSDAAKWGWAALSSRLAPVGPQAFSLHAWSVPRGADTVMGTVAAPGGQSAVSMRAVAGRSRVLGRRDPLPRRPGLVRPALRVPRVQGQPGAGTSTP